MFPEYWSPFALESLQVRSVFGAASACPSAPPPRPVLPTASNRRYLLDEPQRIQERWAGVTETRMRWMEARDSTVVIARQGLGGLSRAQLCWVFLGGGSIKEGLCRCVCIKGSSGMCDLLSE